ncbi:transaldolase [Fusarium tjaetaba]|uniref:Transaldolase n=1 Tax=Fusarium tjaetaba TaxID=1567544 RepID=A0A8H5RG27_9HYPO|nr:transaldolase [Fusarium tjaetaba]KAF5632398.1 transaldolase [Fusarium tjaetaba]
MEEMTGIESSAGQDESSLDYVSSDITAARLDLLVSPSDSHWVEKHKFFTERLKSDTPIRDIVRENFTYNESRMLMPSDRSDVKELQAANTKRYEALLKDRFKGYEDSLATKLTMMYFGLPIAPMEDILKELSMAMGMGKDVPMYNIKPPMHFLTAHDRRNWGKDSLKAKEAFSWPVPAPKTNDPILSLRGGDGPQRNDHVACDYVPSTETPATAEEPWTYIYSHYGRLPFRPRKWRSFALVLRQLLHNHPDDIREKQYIFDLHVIYKETGQRQVIHDRLPLSGGSRAMHFLEGHFAHGSKDKTHKDCCTLFIDHARKESGNTVNDWEPSMSQLETDTVRIGRALGTFPNGPEEEAISYAYIPFPKIDTSRFVASNYASQQYNAHFRAATDILFGRPMGNKNAGCPEYNHALFRLYDRNKPDASSTVPIVYGAMSLPQSALELLHPLNNPGACWMIECNWLDPNVVPLILPNYYPSPNPHLLDDDKTFGDAYENVYHPIGEISSEAFDIESHRKLESVYVLEGDPTNNYGQGIKGLKVALKPRNFGWRKDAVGIAVAEKIQNLSAWFFTIHPHFRPGHCRLFPAWHDGQDISIELPPLTSTVQQLFTAIDQLVSQTKYMRLMGQDLMLLKETFCAGANNREDRDTPSYLIRPDSSDDEWYRVRESITSPAITVEFVSKSDVDWEECISEYNIWGVRGLDSEFYVSRPRLGGDTLEIKDINDNIADPTANYPSSPASLGPLSSKDEEEPVKPRSSLRSNAFVSHTLPHVEISAPKLVLPQAPTLHGESEAEEEEKEEQECDVGVLATDRPDWANKPYSPDRRRVYRSESSEAASEAATEAATEETNIYDYSGGEAPSRDVSEAGDASEQMEGITTPSDHSGDKSSRGDDDAGSDDDGDGSEGGNGTGHAAASRPGPPNSSPWDLDENAPRQARQRTWTTQPSIYGDLRAGSEPVTIGIPLTGAPAEPLLRTDDSGNIPMISKAVLTPTEQAKLQRTLWETRNLLLKRTMRCIYEDCDFTCRADDHEARKKHTREAHKSRMCPWCDEPMFEWWDKAQRNKHMREKHTKDLKDVLGIVDKPTPRTAPAVPRPSMPPQRPAVNPPQASQPQSNQPFSLGQVDNPFADPFVAISTTPPGRIPAPMARMVPNTVPDPEFQRRYEEQRRYDEEQRRYEELMRSARPVPPNLPFGGRAPRPPTAETRTREMISHPPRIQREPEEARNSREAMNRYKRLHPPRTLTNPLAWYDMTGPVIVIDPPRVCGIRGCKADVSRLGSYGLYDHITVGHGVNEAPKCPFCELPFFVVEGTDEEGNEIKKYRGVTDCTKHLDCHVYELWEHLQPVLERPEMVYHNNTGSPLRGEVETVVVIEPETYLEGLPVPQDTVVRKCEYFGDCGMVIGNMTFEEYDRHIEKWHTGQVSDDEGDDEDMGDVDADADDESKDDSDSDSDHGDENGGSSSKRHPSGRSRARGQAARNASKSRSSSPGPRVTEVLSEDEVVGESNKSTGAVVVTKKPAPPKPAPKPPSKKALGKRKATTQDIESAAESHSEAPSTVSRGRRGHTKAQEEPPEATASSTEARGSEAQGSASGRTRSKKTRKTRRKGEKDSQYEDDGYETNDYDEEPNKKGGKSFRRRAKSPDWVKKLGPEDPNFDPDEDMYCSKCLRKMPKKRSKTRDTDVKAHTNKLLCCRIRNAPGSTERLPNRSGWIKGSDIPETLGDIKKSFRRRYPTYARTLYPTNPADHYISIWRSDPNNPENSVWWDIPWPPYEGDPPFPGRWEAPGLPWDNTKGGRKRRKMYTGVEVPDSLYINQSETDTDVSMRGTFPENLSNLTIDATPALKRPERPIASIEEETEEQPAAKKPKLGTIPRRGKNPSSQPSRESSRLRMQRDAAASTAPSAAVSRASSVAVAASAPKAPKAAPKSAPKAPKAPPKAAPKRATRSKTATPAPESAPKPARKPAAKTAPKRAAGSKAATPAPEPEYDSSDPDR